MRLKCRCHGVSGSCAVKTCWRTMSSFRKIGNFLKRKYEKSVEVAPRTRRLLRRRDRRRRRKSIGVLDLVHARQSPNYCRRNDRLGVFGTKGRACRRRSKRADRCEFLCCGRGYNTRVIRRSERCRCKFIWCCSVVCDTCRVTIEKHSCKWRVTAARRDACATFAVRNPLPSPVGCVVLRAQICANIVIIIITIIAYTKCID